jgi:hypothetical protein
MCRYVYGYHLDHRDGEIFYCFPKFPEIISALRKSDHAKKTASELDEFLSDAVVTALQARMSTKREIPACDNVTLKKADGFVILSVPQAMKLELYKLYKENCRSIADFSRQIGKQETAARRLLDLRHQSWASEIELAFETFGKRLVHSWDIELAPHIRAAPSSAPGSHP